MVHHSSLHLMWKGQSLRWRSSTTFHPPSSPRPRLSGPTVDERSRSLCDAVLVVCRHLTVDHGPHRERDLAEVGFRGAESELSGASYPAWRLVLTYLSLRRRLRRVARDHSDVARGVAREVGSYGGRRS